MLCVIETKEREERGVCSEYVTRVKRRERANKEKMEEVGIITDRGLCRNDRERQLI